jgi:hypothetical protein
VVVLLLEQVEAVMFRVDWRRARGTDVRPSRWVVRLRERIASDQAADCCDWIGLEVEERESEEMKKHDGIMLLKPFLPSSPSA